MREAKPTIVLALDKSTSIAASMPGCCTFTATSVPSCKRARCTWPIDALASGSASNSAKSCSSGRPSSRSISGLIFVNGEVLVAARDRAARVRTPRAARRVRARRRSWPFVRLLPPNPANCRAVPAPAPRPPCRRRRRSSRARSGRRPGLRDSGGPSDRRVHLAHDSSTYNTGVTAAQCPVSVMSRPAPGHYASMRSSSPIGSRVQYAPVCSRWRALVNR